MKILHELSPVEILNWGTYQAYPMLKNRLMQTKGSLQSAKRSISRIAKTGQPKSKAIKAEIVRAIEKDPTLYGDAFRAAETARQAGGTYLLQNLPPLPMADAQSLSQTFDGVKSLTGDQEARKRMAQNVKRGLTTKPLKHAYDFVVDRATASTYTGSPLTNYSSSLFGINGPIVDNNSISGAFNAAGVKNGAQLLGLAKQAGDYYKAKALNAGYKVKDGLKSVLKRAKQYSFMGNQ